MSRHAALLLVALIVVFASCATAVLAHVAIDLLGDVLLANDTYDRIAHGSRSIVLAIGTALATLVGLWIWVAAFGDVRGGTTGPMRATLASGARLARSNAAVGATVGLALLLIAIMAIRDAADAGSAALDLRAAYGGSLVLGVFVTLAIGTCVAWLAARILGSVARSYGTFVAIVRDAIILILALARVSNAGTIARARTPRPRFVARSILSRRAGRRGPPPVLRLV